MSWYCTQANVVLTEISSRKHVIVLLDTRAAISGTISKMIVIDVGENLPGAVEEAFRLIENAPSLRVGYFNCTSPEILQHTMSVVDLKWTNDQERLQLFDYQRVNDIEHLWQVLCEESYDTVIIEQIEDIINEPTILGYNKENDVLTRVLNKVNRCERALCLTSWDYIHRYYKSEIGGPEFYDGSRKNNRR